MNIKISHLALPGLLFALFTGCATRPSGGPPLDPRILVDSSARGLVQVVRVDYATTAGKTPSLHVSLRGESTRAHAIEYKIDWFRPEGQPRDTTLSAWQKARLSPGEIRDLQLVAPNEDINNFRLQIRRAD